MLAVQQAPVMASDRSPDPFLPFGYSIDPNQEPPMDPPPEPPSGAPLLTEHDSKFLSSFFDDITADQYNMPSFGEGLNFSDTWLDLPPQFMGTATSFGEQQAGPSMASSSAPSMPSDPMAFHGSASTPQMMPPPPPPQQLQHHQHHQHHQIPQHAHHGGHQQSHHHSDDVLNAAATLLNNNQQPPTPNHADMRLPQRAMGPPVGHLRHQGLEEFQEDGRRSLAPNPNSNHDNTFANEWMMGSQGRSVPRNAPSGLPTDFQWGSDSNFSMSQRYTPDANRETVESMHREQLKLLDSLEVNQSAASTRPSSPSHAQNQQTTNHTRQQAPQARMPEESDAPPRKRRKSKINREGGDDEDDEPAAAKPSSRRKSKIKKEASDASPSSEGSKKRKAAVNGSSKASRENLSEEQKRENHIRSEQKRRTLIKEGFDDLCELVPALRSGGYSKSTMLNLAASWLEELLEGNKKLEKQLADLEGKS